MARRSKRTASAKGSSRSATSKRKKPEVVATAANNDSKPSALDDDELQQLNAIGYDRDKLKAFKQRLDEVIETMGVRDSFNYVKLLGAVEDRLARLSATPPSALFPGTAANLEPLCKVPAVTTPNQNKLSATVLGFVEQARDKEGRNDALMMGVKASAEISTDKIQVQKGRAKKQLDDSFAEKTISESIADKNSPTILAIIAEEDEETIQPLADKNHPTMQAIRAALDDGCVKPLFHAQFLPETFLGNHRSLSAVTAGEFDEERQLKFDESANNLDKVVLVADESGYYDERGAASIIDGGMANNWEFSCMQTAFAVELVNTDADMLGEDIECTKLGSIPKKINPNDKLLHLLTRRESRGVVRDIFHRFARETGESVTAITGSPGIGKSWTLLYALQQALLYDGATVLFFFQKTDNAVMYLRRNNKMYAWTSESNPFAKSRLFKRLDVLVLLDPKEAMAGGANVSLGEMKFLYAASNNKGYFTTTLEKNYEDLKAYLGPPLDSELYVILQRINPSLTHDVIEERKDNVGNQIRYILSETFYKKRVEATKVAVQQCVTNPALLEQALNDEGMSNGQDTILETLFQVMPKRPDDLTSMGYDGQLVQYREQVVLAVNKNVRKAILRKKRQI